MRSLPDVLKAVTVTLLIVSGVVAAALAVNEILKNLNSHKPGKPKAQFLSGLD